MRHVFLSYASEDEQKAELLAKLLETSGLEVWWDREIPPGQTWDDVIGQHLDTAGCVIVLWSQVSVKSRWVREEADRALARECLLPVMIDSSEPPLGFGRIQAADLRSWQGGTNEQAFVNLLASIRRILKVDTPPVHDKVKPGVDGHDRAWEHSMLSRFHNYRYWLIVTVITVLVAPFILWYMSTQSDKQVWFLIQSVQVEKRLANALIKVMVWVNDIEHHYPSIGGAEWMEVGPSMSPHRFKVPSANSYEVRFEMIMRTTEIPDMRFISQDTDVFENLPHDGQYTLHEVNVGTRSASPSATIIYRLFQP